MEMKNYKLTATSDLYKTTYNIRATSLIEASKQAKVKFARSYHVFGDNVKIGLSPDDLRNHIDEIMAVLHKGGN